MKTPILRKTFIISVILLFAGSTLAFADHHGQKNTQSSRTGSMASDWNPSRIYVFGTGGLGAAVEMDQTQTTGAGMVALRIPPSENASQVYVFGTSAHGRKNAMTAQGSTGFTKVYRQSRLASPGRIYVEGTGEVH